MSRKESYNVRLLYDASYETSLDHSSRALTQYILYREKIIQKMRQMSPSNSESEIHNLIVPRYESFEKVDFAKGVYRNNAWLLDDKFMSFQTILSEGRMDAVIEAVTLQDSPIQDDGRPDISLIFSDDPSDVPSVDVVVVELKRITDAEKENQFVVNQLLLRARKLVAHCPNIERMWYYAVININKDMEDVLLQQKFTPMYSKGKIFYQEYETRRPDGKIAITPVFLVSYDSVVSDAQSRNHTFLEILRNTMREHSEKVT
ncbi:MAG: hypothetical protein ACPGSB_10480 [Opitutales bacterium]